MGVSKMDGSLRINNPYGSKCLRGARILSRTWPCGSGMVNPCGWWDAPLISLNKVTRASCIWAKLTHQFSPGIVLPFSFSGVIWLPRWSPTVSQPWDAQWRVRPRYCAASRICGPRRAEVYGWLGRSTNWIARETMILYFFCNLIGISTNY